MSHTHFAHLPKMMSAQVKNMIYSLQHVLVSPMVRACLLPSSPQRPHFAFSFELLNWAESLLLEAQVSLNDFCKAITFKCQHLLTKASN